MKTIQRTQNQVRLKPHKQLPDPHILPPFTLESRKHQFTATGKSPSRVIIFKTLYKRSEKQERTNKQTNKTSQERRATAAEKKNACRCITTASQHKPPSRLSFTEFHATPDTTRPCRQRVRPHFISASQPEPQFWCGQREFVSR